MATEKSLEETCATKPPKKATSSGAKPPTKATSSGAKPPAGPAPAALAVGTVPTRVAAMTWNIQPADERKKKYGDFDAGAHYGKVGKEIQERAEEGELDFIGLQEYGNDKEPGTPHPTPAESMSALGYKMLDVRG